MDEKALTTLEFFKILEFLAGYCAFSASSDKARALRPTKDIEMARQWLKETSEAVQLLVTHPDLTIGGARDIRGAVELAQRGGVLTPSELLDVKSTLIAARNLARTFERLEAQYPLLSAIASRMNPPVGMIDVITRTISERAEILDSASEKLAGIRRDMRIAHDRLMTKLQRLVSDSHSAQYLQEALVTQRDGRYVIPLRAEFKGRIKAIVHDQSQSGATLFVEPLAVVELNNQYRELQLAERDEERRILAELSSEVGFNSFVILQTLDVVAELDLAMAKARFAEALSATEPVIKSVPVKPFAEATPERRHPGSVVRLFQARHPLLDPESVMPIDVELDERTYALVVTGPNTGGKTVALKTIGLLAFMAQAGLHIPAHSGSEISLFEDIYADIGDEQSIEQSLSTFSGHITNIIRILKQANRRSLVILDELGAGTDPQEGAALARAILSHLLERGITTLVTTHHPELKAFAHSAAGAINASVEFDMQTLRPTYRLTIGLPGRSNALAIAKRLGLPKAIIDQARDDLDPAELRAEDLLNEIHYQRDAARKARGSADRARHEAEKMRNELVERLERIEDERRKIIELAHAEAEADLAQLKDELRDARRQLARARQPADVLQAVEEKFTELEAQIETPVERQEPAYGPGMESIIEERRRAIRLGDKVRLRTLGTQGVVIALGVEDAEVSVGMLRIKARLSDLELPGTELETAGEKVKSNRRKRMVENLAANTSTKQSGETFVASPGMELDLRGQRAEDALDALERYLDAVFVVGMPFVRIIHGKGTGKLREIVRQTLQQHPHVASFEGGGDKEGGEGVTVVKLR